MESGQLAEQIVEAIQQVSGRHHGHRAVHAKGTLCAATFTPAPSAGAMSRAVHFQGEPVRAHVRFSNGSGDPGSPDGAQDARGMAVKFYLPDGSTTDIVAISRRQFFVRTPEDFLEFTLARSPDPGTGQPDMEKLGAFLAAHPEAVPAVQEHLASKPPRSYATSAYNALHTFAFLAPDGTRRWVRYHWQPEAAEETVEPDQAEGLEADYLQRELGERLAAGPVRFALSVAVADDGDPIDDPTQAWPDQRQTVELGRLEITALAHDRERDGDVLVFDPTRVTDGIELSDDPILHARSHVYAESVLRRSGVARA